MKNKKLWDFYWPRLNYINDYIQCNLLLNFFFFWYIVVSYVMYEYVWLFIILFGSLTKRFFSIVDINMLTIICVCVCVWFSHSFSFYIFIFLFIHLNTYHIHSVMFFLLLHHSIGWGHLFYVHNRFRLYTIVHMYVCVCVLRKIHSSFCFRYEWISIRPKRRRKKRSLNNRFPMVFS